MAQFSYWRPEQFATRLGASTTATSKTEAQARLKVEVARLEPPPRAVVVDLGDAQVVTASEPPYPAGRRDVAADDNYRLPSDDGVGASDRSIGAEPNDGDTARCGDEQNGRGQVDAGAALVRLAQNPTPGALVRSMPPKHRDSMESCIKLYHHIHVVGAPERTAKAKTQDLRRFVKFFNESVCTDRVDDWTPSVSKVFLRELQEAPIERTGAPLKPSSISRIFKTLGHFAKWLMQERPLIAGHPLAGVPTVYVPNGAFRGLTDLQVMRMKAAIDRRLGSKRRLNQEPRLEAAVFYLMAGTGLREFEVCRLNLSQYQRRGLHRVHRKGAKVTEKVPLPAEARQMLDRYIDEVRGREPGPLFVTRQKTRITERVVAYIFEVLSNEASAHLPQPQKFRATPHMARHYFLKKIADKEGVHVAQEMSGNISISEIFRYTKPSEDEIAAFAERAF